MSNPIEEKLDACTRCRFRHYYPGVHKQTLDNRGMLYSRNCESCPVGEHHAAVTWRRFARLPRAQRLQGLVLLPEPKETSQEPARLPENVLAGPWHGSRGQSLPGA